MDQPPKHRWFENPFKALQVLPEEGEGQDPTSYLVREHENRWGEHIEDISKDVIVQAATQGRFGDTPASEQTVDVAATEVLDLHPNIYRQAVVYHRNNPDAGWGAAIKAAKLSAGSSPETLRRRFMKSPKDRFPDAGNVEARLRKRKGESDDDFANRLFQDKFNKVNLTEDARLDVESMLDTKNVSQKERRNIKMGISNPDYSPKSYTETRKILVEEFLDGLEFLGLKDTQIEAHHIASLRQTASLFIGLPRSEFRDMLKLIYDNGIPTGNDPDNLMAIQKKAHVNKKDNPNIYAVHTYLNEQLGLYGEKLVGDFGINVKDLTLEQRLPFIKKFAAVVKGSVPIAEQAIRDVLDIDVQADSPEAAAIASLDIQDYEISKSQMKQIKAKVDDYIKLQLTEPNYQALIDSIMGEDSPAEAMRRLGVKPGQPVQGQLLNIKKPPRKTKKKDDSYPSGSGAYWDIESE